LQSFDVIGSGPAVTPSLFASIGAQGGTPHTGVTSWPVTIDVAALGTLPPSLVMNFPDRASATLMRGRYQDRGAGAFLWTGRGGDCSAVFTVAPVVLYGAISCLNANYGVGQAIGGSALTLNRYIDDASSPLAKPVEPATSAVVAIPHETLAAANDPPDTVIDILVIYNEATRAHFDPNGGKAATIAFAQLCVDATQNAMDNSTAGWQPGQTPIATVNLVAAKEVAGPPSPQLIFDYQRYAENDPEPTGLRNLYAADAVVYLVENGINAYGVSSIPGSTPPGGTPLPPPGPGFAPLAISVVQRNTAVSDDTGTYPQEPYVFPHEFAHLIGANHDVANAGNNTTPLQRYAYGWYRPQAEGGARTIMAYYPQNGCQAPCTRVQNYSNPQVFANGDQDWFRTGTVTTADNALVIADYSSYTAQYRPSLGRIFYDGFDN
jgi:hypothetical protein